MIQRLGGKTYTYHAIETLLSKSSTFQAWTDAATEQEAAEHVHFGEVLIKAGQTTLESWRPYALITVTEHSLLADGENSHLTNVAVQVQFNGKWPESAEDAKRAFSSFEESIDGIIEDLRTLMKDDYLTPPDGRLVFDIEQTTHVMGSEQNEDDPFIFCEYRFSESEQPPE